MANKKFQLRVMMPGEKITSITITAADAQSASHAAESAGWAVLGIEEVVETPAPEPDATLNSLRDELRELRRRVDVIGESSMVQSAGMTVFWACMGALVAFSLVSCVIFRPFMR